MITATKTLLRFKANLNHSHCYWRWLSTTTERFKFWFTKDLYSKSRPSLDSGLGVNIHYGTKNELGPLSDQQIEALAEVIISEDASSLLNSEETTRAFYKGLLNRGSKLTRGKNKQPIEKAKTAETLDSPTQVCAVLEKKKYEIRYDVENASYPLMVFDLDYTKDGGYNQKEQAIRGIKLAVRYQVPLIRSQSGGLHLIFKRDNQAVRNGFPEKKLTRAASVSGFTPVDYLVQGQVTGPGTPGRVIVYLPEDWAEGEELSIPPNILLPASRTEAGCKKWYNNRPNTASPLLGVPEGWRRLTLGHCWRAKPKLNEEDIQELNELICNPPKTAEDLEITVLNKKEEILSDLDIYLEGVDQERICFDAERNCFLIYEAKKLLTWTRVSDLEMASFCKLKPKTLESGLKYLRITRCVSSIREERDNKHLQLPKHTFAIHTHFSFTVTLDPESKDASYQLLENDDIRTWFIEDRFDIQTTPEETISILNDLKTREWDIYNLTSLARQVIPSTTAFLANKFSDDYPQIKSANVEDLISLLVFAALKGQPCHYKEVTPRVVVFKGPGGSGKSTLTNLFSCFVPQQRVFAGDLNDITNRFETYFMQNKSLITFSDETLNHSTFGRTRKATMLKKLTGNEKLRLEQKYGDVGFFENQAMLLMSTNSAIAAEYNEEYVALKRRFNIFHIDKNHASGVQIKDYDKVLFQEEGLKLLLMALCFSSFSADLVQKITCMDEENEVLHSKAWNLYDDRVDPYRGFLEHSLVCAPKNESNFVTVRELMANYIQWNYYRPGSSKNISNPDQLFVDLNTLINDHEERGKEIKRELANLPHSSDVDSKDWETRLVRCLKTRMWFIPNLRETDWERRPVTRTSRGEKITSYQYGLVGVRFKDFTFQHDQHWLLNPESKAQPVKTRAEWAEVRSKANKNTKRFYSTQSDKDSWSFAVNQKINEYHEWAQEMKLAGLLPTIEPVAGLCPQLEDFKDLEQTQLELERESDNPQNIADEVKSMLAVFEGLTTRLGDNALARAILESACYVTQVLGSHHVKTKAEEEYKVFIPMNPLAIRWLQIGFQYKLYRVGEDESNFLSKMVQRLEDRGYVIEDRELLPTYKRTPKAKTTLEYFKNKKKLGQKSFFLVVESKDQASLEAAFTKLATKPMLVPPADWRLRNKTVCGGGYLLSKEAGLSLYQNWTPELNINIQWDRGYVKRLNRAQGLAFKIDLSLVPEVFSDWFDHYMHIMNYEYNDNIDDIVFATKRFEEETDPRKKARALSNLKWHTQLVRKAAFKAKDLVAQVYLVRALENYLGSDQQALTVYQPLKVDRIGRMYREGMLNITNSKFLRGLLGNPLRVASNKVDSSVLGLIKASHKIVTDKGSKKWMASRHVERVLGKAEGVVFFDATSSMIQIYALLFADLELAKWSNLGDLPPTDANRCLSKDLIAPEHLQPAAGMLLTRRNVIKSFIMLKLYGAGKMGLLEIVEKESLDWKHWDPDSSWKIVDSKRKEFTNWLDTTLEARFEPLFDFVRVSLAKTKEVAISWQGNLSTYQYLTKKDIEVNLKPGLTAKGNSSRRRMKLSVPNITKVNTQKTRRSALSGMIHSLDAEVALRLVNEMRRRRKWCASVHDCFACDLADVPLLLKLYKEVLFKVAFDKDPADILGVDKQLSQSTQQLKTDAVWSHLRSVPSPNCLKIE